MAIGLVLIVLMRFQLKVTYGSQAAYASIMVSGQDITFISHK